MLTLFYLTVIISTLFISVVNSSSSNLARQVKNKINTSSQALFSDLPLPTNTDEQTREDKEQEAVLSA